MNSALFEDPFCSGQPASHEEVFDAMASLAEESHRINAMAESRYGSLVHDLPEFAVVYDPIERKTIGPIQEASTVRDTDTQQTASLKAIREAQRTLNGAKLSGNLIMLTTIEPNAMTVATMDQADLESVVYGVQRRDIDFKEPESMHLSSLNKQDREVWQYTKIADSGIEQSRLLSVYERYKANPWSGAGFTLDNTEDPLHLPRSFHTGDIDPEKHISELDSHAPKIVRAMQARLAELRAEHTGKTADELIDIPVDIIVAAGVFKLRNATEAKGGIQLTRNLLTGDVQDHGEKIAIRMAEQIAARQLIEKYGNGPMIWPMVKLMMSDYGIVGNLECCLLCATTAHAANVGAAHALTATDEYPGNFKARKRPISALEPVFGNFITSRIMSHHENELRPHQQKQVTEARRIINDNQGRKLHTDQFYLLEV